MKYVIFGGGSVTAEYYLPAFRSMGRLDDVVVIDRDAPSIRSERPEFAEVEFLGGDYQRLIADLSERARAADCVIVALPNQLHVEAVRLALGQKRHVLCEKPLALSASACADLRALAAAGRRCLKVAMSRRYLPSLMLAQEIVQAGELGEVRSVEVRDCAPNAWQPRSFAFFSREAGGVLADLGVHYLDYLQILVGDLKPLSYNDDAAGGAEASAVYKLAAGTIPVEMRLSRIHGADSWIKIGCARGEIFIDKRRETEVIVTRGASSRRRVSSLNSFDDVAWPNDFRGSFCQLLADFERAIAGVPSRIADVADAERTAALIEWAYSHRQGRVAATSPSNPSPSGRRVLVTGGSGFIGGHLVERLSRGDNEIRVTARTPRTCANVARFPVDLVATDLLDKNSVERAVAGARTIYHLAYGSGGANARDITVDGTKNVVDAAIAAQAECVVVLSTMYVYGFPSGGGPVDESFPYRPYGGEYGTSKAAVERWCLERARSSLPTRIVVLNPTCVFGPGGGAYTRLPVDLVRQGQFCWIDDGIGLCNYNYVENLIDAIVAAGESPQAHGNRFIINDGAVTWREFLTPLIQPLTSDVPSYSAKELARLPRYGGPFRFSDLAAAAFAAPDIRAVAKRSATIRKMFASLRQFQPEGWNPAGNADLDQGNEPAAVPPEWLASLYPPARSVFSARKAEEVLQWRPRIDLTAALAATLQWLVEDGRLPAESTVSGGTHSALPQSERGGAKPG